MRDDARADRPRACERGGARIDALLLLPAPSGRARRGLPRWRATAASRRPGMIRRAARELGLDLSRSFVVGDRWLDVRARARRPARGASWCAPGTALARGGAAGRRAAPADARAPTTWSRRVPPGSSRAEASALSRRSLMQNSRTPTHPDADRLACSRSSTASPAPRRGRRRPHRRRVPLRPDRARVARGAGPDPALRRHARSCRAARATPPTTSRRSAGRVRPVRPASGATSRAARWSRRFPRGVDCAASCGRAGYRTPTKTRILAGGIHSAKQQVVRIDREPRTRRRRRCRSAFAAKVLRGRRRRRRACCCPTTAAAWSRRRWREAVVAPAAVAPAQPAPVLVDSRYNLGAYRGLTACTPNESEVEQLLGVRIGDDARRARAGRAHAAAAHAHAGGARHARQPRHGALRAGDADRAHPDLRHPTRSPT